MSRANSRCERSGSHRLLRALGLGRLLPHGTLALRLCFRFFLAILRDNRDNYPKDYQKEDCPLHNYFLLSVGAGFVPLPMAVRISVSEFMFCMR